MKAPLDLDPSLSGHSPEGQAKGKPEGQAKGKPEGQAKGKKEGS
jgi:hypothetical protein